MPTIVTGRFRTLVEAERVITDGVADMVSMVRALIADPDLVRKTRDGRADEVRPCIACNQGCYGGVSSGRRMACTVNPAVGYERTLSEDLITLAANPAKVLVVGGGPAGLEAARVAALCGHDVTLVEASSRLGGAVGAASPVTSLRAAWRHCRVARGRRQTRWSPRRARHRADGGRRSGLRRGHRDRRHRLNCAYGRSPTDVPGPAGPRSRADACALLDGAPDGRRSAGRSNRARSRHGRALRGDRGRRVSRRERHRRDLRDQPPRASGGPRSSRASETYRRSSSSTRASSRCSPATISSRSAHPAAP